MLKRTCRPGYTKKMARLDHLLSGRAGIYLRDAANALMLKARQDGVKVDAPAPQARPSKKSKRGS